MAATGLSACWSLIKFIDEQLKMIVPAFGKEDLDNLRSKIKLVEDLLKMVERMENGKLQEMLERHGVYQDLDDIKRELEQRKFCPVDVCKRELTLGECLQHSTDHPITDEFKTCPGNESTDDTVAAPGIVVANYVPPGFIPAVIGLAKGLLINTSKYEAHKKECSNRLQTLLRKMERVHSAMDSIISMDTNERVHNMKCN